MVYNGKPYLNGWFGGKTHYFRKHPYTLNNQGFFHVLMASPQEGEKRRRIEGANYARRAAEKAASKKAPVGGGDGWVDLAAPDF